MPFHIAVLILQRASPDFKQPHRHPRPHLSQLDALVARLHEDVVPDLDAVFDILERDDSTSDFVVGRDGFAGREEVF